MFLRIAMRVLFALVILGLLVGGAFAVYRMGTIQGYQAGLQVSQNSNPQAAPAAPYFYAPWGFYHPFFAPLGFIFPILGILFIFFLVTIPFRMMGRRAMWRHMMAGGPQSDAWEKDRMEHFRHIRDYWEGRHNPADPEHQGDQESTEKKV